jgi:VanZ family protein
MYKKISIFWMLLLFVLSTASIKNITVSPTIMGIPTDKIAHLSMYFVLAFLLLLAFVEQYANGSAKIFTVKATAKMQIIAVTIASLYGIFLEILQEKFFLTRCFDVNDIIANIMGVILALLIYVITFSLIKK